MKRHKGHHEHAAYPAAGGNSRHAGLYHVAGKTTVVGFGRAARQRLCLYWVVRPLGPRRMSSTHLETKSLKLIAQTREEARAYIEQMQPHERAQVSPAWLALLDGSSSLDSWLCAAASGHRERHRQVWLHGASRSRRRG
jgi:hypothetical protein